MYIFVLVQYKLWFRLESSSLAVNVLYLYIIYSSGTEALREINDQTN